MNFATAAQISAQYGERNDCAVKAVAIATGTDYRTVHALMKKHGRRDRKGTPVPITFKVLKELGFKTVAVPPKARTVKTIAPTLTGGAYLVRTAGHILAVRDGKAEDWTEGRRHRVQEVYRVERIELPKCPTCHQPVREPHEHEEPELPEVPGPELEPPPVPKKQSTRMLKVICPGCGYTVRTTQKWIDIGLPTCPCGEEMEVAQ